MPTFIHSKDGQVLINQYDLSAYFNAYAVQAQLATHDTTCLGDQSPKYAPGLKSGQASVDGFFSSDALLGSDVAIPPLLGVSVPVISVAPRGTALGNRVYVLQELLETYDIGVKVADMVRNHASFKSVDGFDFGVSLHPLQAETTSANGASVDNGAATTNGSVAQIHVPAVSGGTPNAAIKVQHSADNSTWADLAGATFTAATAPTSQRLVVAAGTTVNRYLRVVWTIAGTTPSFSFQVSFARR